MIGKFVTFAAVPLWALLGATAVSAGGNVKVEVCHLPPDNPDNFHTITVGVSALQAHLDHGDLDGSCLANCEELCGDGNACTIDCDPSTEACLPAHPPVDCDDTNACTTDTCDTASGCLNLEDVCDDGNDCSVDLCSDNNERVECNNDIPVADGEVCDDGVPSTSDDACTGGICAGTRCPCLPPGGMAECVTPGGAPLSFGLVDLFDSPGLVADGDFACDGSSFNFVLDVSTQVACLASCASGHFGTTFITSEELDACIEQMADFCLANDPPCNLRDFRTP